MANEAFQRTIDGCSAIVEDHTQQWQTYLIMLLCVGISSENASHRYDRHTQLLTTTNNDKLAGNSKY